MSDNLGRRRMGSIAMIYHNIRFSLWLSKAQKFMEAEGMDRADVLFWTTQPAVRALFFDQYYFKVDPVQAANQYMTDMALAVNVFEKGVRS